MQLSVSMSRASVSGEVCWPRANQPPKRTQKGAGSATRVTAQPVQSNWNHQGSLSQYISTFKTCHFPQSLSPHYFNASQERGTSGCSYSNAQLFGGRRQQGSGRSPTLCHAMATDFYVCSLRSVSGHSAHVVGSAKAPCSSLTRTTWGQGQPHQAAKELTAQKLVFPACRNPLVLKGLSAALSFHPFQVQGKIEGCKSPVVQCQ